VASGIDWTKNESAIQLAADKMAEPKPNPLVSVVVLNYNGAKWISQCIESVFKQTIRGQIETDRRGQQVD
jgi:hypothetical protein